MPKSNHMTSTGLTKTYSILITALLKYFLITNSHRALTVLLGRLFQCLSRLNIFWCSFELFPGLAIGYQGEEIGTSISTSPYSGTFREKCDCFLASSRLQSSSVFSLSSQDMSSNSPVALLWALLRNYLILDIIFYSSSKKISLFSQASLLLCLLALRHSRKCLLVGL